jgi:hypothetical protein
MSKFEFCLPTTGKIVRAGADWLHGIKYDGYRRRVERNGSAAAATIGLRVFLDRGSCAEEPPLAVRD